MRYEESIAELLEPIILNPQFDYGVESLVEKMDELTRWRTEIDRIDKALVPLFEERMHIAQEIAAYKAAHGLPIYQAERERQVLLQAASRLSDPSLAPALGAWLRTLMDLSQKAQALHPEFAKAAPGEVLVSADSLVGFQGLPGSFSEQALRQFFGENTATKNYTEFEDVFVALSAGSIAYAALPCENSTTGAITSVYDLLGRYGAFIVGETRVEVQQHLLGLPGAQPAGIKEIYSHPQGFAQCSEYLKTGSWQLIPSSNTATAAKFVRDTASPSRAAIASSRAAELYGLSVLAPQINNNLENYTRFVIISREMPAALPPDIDKISVCFTLTHRSGSLHAVLGAFASKALNLLKIESRPIPGNLWQYSFYVDFSGHPEHPEVREALGELREKAATFRLLGAYKSAGTEFGG
jgi:chorismate mutase/prephenate dehydratase